MMEQKRDREDDVHLRIRSDPIKATRKYQEDKSVETGRKPL